MYSCTEALVRLQMKNTQRPHQNLYINKGYKSDTDIRFII